MGHRDDHLARGGRATDVEPRGGRRPQCPGVGAVLRWAVLRRAALHCATLQFDVDQGGRRRVHAAGRGHGQVPQVAPGCVGKLFGAVGGNGDAHRLRLQAGALVGDADGGGIGELVDVGIIGGHPYCGEHRAAGLPGILGPGHCVDDLARTHVHDRGAHAMVPDHRIRARVPGGQVLDLADDRRIRGDVHGQVTLRAFAAGEAPLLGAVPQHPPADGCGAHQNGDQHQDQGAGGHPVVRLAVGMPAHARSAPSVVPRPPPLGIPATRS